VPGDGVDATQAPEVIVWQVLDQGLRECEGGAVAKCPGQAIHVGGTGGIEVAGGEKTLQQRAEDQLGVVVELVGGEGRKRMVGHRGLRPKQSD
jgi:hypothetical protein